MGVGSRSDLKKAIRKSLVTVNGAVEKDPGAQVSAEDRSCFDGAEIRYAEQQYYMLHKPAGVLSASEDRRQTTVVDLIRDAASTDASAANASAADHHAAGGHADGSIARSTEDALVRKDLFPVGRLDKDTEGLLLLTDDGALAHDLLAPKKHVDKVYFVCVDGTLDEKDCAAFAAGMTLGDGLACLPARLEILSAGARSEALVTIREGKFHQIKRMLAARGKPVVYLKRLSMGPLTLDETLPKGAYRLLTEEETALLRAR